MITEDMIQQELKDIVTAINEAWLSGSMTEWLDYYVVNHYFIIDKAGHYSGARAMINLGQHIMADYDTETGVLSYRQNAVRKWECTGVSIVAQNFVDLYFQEKWDALKEALKKE